MSFASEVKKELLNISSLDECCKKAVLYGLLQGNSEIMITSSGLKIVVKSTILNVLKKTSCAPYKRGLGVKFIKL